MCDFAVSHSECSARRYGQYPPVKSRERDRYRNGYPTIFFDNQLYMMFHSRNDRGKADNDRVYGVSTTNRIVVSIAKCCVVREPRRKRISIEPIKIGIYRGYIGVCHLTLALVFKRSSVCLTGNNVRQ